MSGHVFDLSATTKDIYNVVLKQQYHLIELLKLIKSQIIKFKCVFVFCALSASQSYTHVIMVSKQTMPNILPSVLVICQFANALTPSVHYIKICFTSLIVNAQCLQGLDKMILTRLIDTAQRLYGTNKT